MILESKDDFDQLAELDVTTGSYRLLSRKLHPESPRPPISGCYSIVNGTMLALYRTGGVLYFRTEDRQFKLTDDVSSTLTHKDNKRVFQLLENENLLVDFSCEPHPPEVPLSIDPTPFLEEEDFDFLLFVHQVLTETGRRHRVYS